jgi:hypothetical protein
LSFWVSKRQTWYIFLTFFYLRKHNRTYLVAHETHGAKSNIKRYLINSRGHRFKTRCTIWFVSKTWMGHYAMGPTHLCPQYSTWAFGCIEVVFFTFLQIVVSNF